LSDAYLLDTHALIWWWAMADRLSSTAADILSDARNIIMVSAVSGLEIATKVRLGRLPVMADRIADFDAAILADGFRHLPIGHDVAVRAGLMAGPHRDPFDRVLAAQALASDVPILTRDREIARFGCKVLW
jgi:PIN domain nuclease of toxin-antitoxin system